MEFWSIRSWIALNPSGHFDTRKTFDRLRTRYWWSTLSKDTKLYVLGCTTCQHVNRRTTSAQGFLGECPIPATPFEVISADHLNLPRTSAGNQYLIVHTCHATHLVIAVPSANTASDDVITANMTSFSALDFQSPTSPIMVPLLRPKSLPCLSPSLNSTLFYSALHSLSQWTCGHVNQTIIATIAKFAVDHPNN